MNKNIKYNWLEEQLITLSQMSRNYERCKGNVDYSLREEITKCYDFIVSKLDIFEGE